MSEKIDVEILNNARQADLEVRIADVAGVDTDEELDLPAAIDATNTILTLRQVVTHSEPDTVRLLGQITEEDRKQQIVIERIQKRKEYNIGTIASDETIINKEIAIQNVTLGNDLGRDLIDIEQRAVVFALERYKAEGGTNR
jgi:hypothetical protein